MDMLISFAQIELLSIACFYVILSTLVIYTVFSTFVRGLLSNWIKDYLYDFHLQPYVDFFFRGLNSFDILLP